jgi:hypothetical protein
VDVMHPLQNITMVYDGIEHHEFVRRV